MVLRGALPYPAAFLGVIAEGRADAVPARTSTSTDERMSSGISGQREMSSARSGGHGPTLGPMESTPCKIIGKTGGFWESAESSILFHSIFSLLYRRSDLISPFSFLFPHATLGKRKTHQLAIHFRDVAGIKSHLVKMAGLRSNVVVDGMRPAAKDSPRPNDRTWPHVPHHDQPPSACPCASK